MTRSWGSPPRMRGKRLAKSKHRAPFGITPAGAGKTADDSAQNIDHEDHPRRCGENSVIYSIVKLNTGSPPQVRGKLTDVVAFVNVLEDHPRRCGENTERNFDIWQPLGSPPQVRGKPRRPKSNIRAGRITPAGAGKTGNCGCNSGCG